MVFRGLLLFIFFLNFTEAQDISGLWVHDQDGINPEGFDQIYAIMYLELSVTGQVNGYTYDFHAGGTCSFYLEGEYDEEKKRLIGANTKKIEKSFLHARSRFKLSYEKNNKDEFLIGRARQKGLHGLVFSFGGLFNIPLKFKKVKPEDYENVTGYSTLKSFIETKRTKDQTIQSKDDLSLEMQEETQESIRLNEEINAFTEDARDREEELFNSYKTTSREITLNIYDNSRQDGDRISIFLNNSLVEYNLEINKTPKIIKISLPNEKKIHKVVFVANNLGRVAPNTVKVRFTVDEVSHEAVLFTNLELNKFIQFIID